VRVELFKGVDGYFYLRLVARNGEILAQSEGYTRRWSARRAARKNFKGIELVEDAP